MKETNKQKQTPETLDTKREIAARLKKSTRWVELKIADGTIPVIKIGRANMFSWPDVLEALQKYRVN